MGTSGTAGSLEQTVLLLDRVQ